MRFLAISGLLVSIAGCQNSGAFHCDGWKPIRMKAATASYIVKNDQEFAADVLGHNEFGERTKCWDAGKTNVGKK